MRNILTTVAQSSSSSSRVFCFSGALVKSCALAAVGAGPGEALLQLDRVVDPLLEPAVELGHVDRFHAHAQVLLEERLVHDGPGDAHRHAAEREVGLAAQDRRGETRLREAQDPGLDVVGDRAVGGVLDVAPVDAERRQALLGVRGEDGGEVDGARPLRAVEAPDRLGRQGVHVHGLGAVAPAGRDGQRDTHALLAEQLGDLGRLVHAADVVVGDHALDRAAVRVAQGAADQLRGTERHVAGLDLERLADPVEAAVDRRADADLRPVADEAAGGVDGSHARSSCSWDASRVRGRVARNLEAAGVCRGRPTRASPRRW